MSDFKLSQRERIKKLGRKKKIKSVREVKRRRMRMRKTKRTISQ